jgi:ribosomal protein L28
MRATRRTFRPNLQRVQVMEDGQLRQKVYCAKCIKRIGRL